MFIYEELKQIVIAEGYSIFIAKSDLEVRILFELEIRGSSIKSFIVAPSDYYPLPDILEYVNFQSIGLGDLFPSLDTKAISGLNFNALCLLSSIKHYEHLGYDKTLIFLLENLYNVDMVSLNYDKRKENILQVLIHVFVEKNGINQAIHHFLSELSKPYFPNLVLKRLDKTNIILYLQEQWNKYVTNELSEIDFEASILNRNLGYLFIFNHLSPIKVSSEKYERIPMRLKMGVFTDENQNNDSDLRAIIHYLNQQYISIENVYDHWLSLIQALAEAKIKALKTENSELKTEFKRFETLLNKRFQTFIENSYNSLFSLSGVRRPIVVSRILDYMKAQANKRKALIVIDGMNYWQWLII